MYFFRFVARSSERVPRLPLMMSTCMTMVKLCQRMGFSLYNRSIYTLHWQPFAIWSRQVMWLQYSFAGVHCTHTHTLAREITSANVQLAVCQSFITNFRLHCISNALANAQRHHQFHAPSLSSLFLLLSTLALLRFSLKSRIINSKASSTTALPQILGTPFAGIRWYYVCAHNIQVQWGRVFVYHWHDSGNSTI